MRKNKLSLAIFTVFELILLSTSALAQEKETNLYLRAGIPAISRDWIGSDFAETSAILTSGKVPLPRLSDAHGAALLNRITSGGNLSLSRDRTISLRIRFGDWLNFQNGVSSLLKMYTEIDEKKNILSDESALLMAYSLHVTALGIDLTRELLEATPRAKSNSAAMDSLRAMYSNLTGVFVGTEMTIREGKGISVAARSNILRAMAETLPKFNETFSEDYRIELRRKLSDIRIKLSLSEDLKKIDTMIHELSNGRGQ